MTRSPVVKSPLCQVLGCGKSNESVQHKPREGRGSRRSMEPPLTRTASSDSTLSWQHLTTASGTSVAGQKARSSEAETGIASVERASVSLPPLGAKAIRQSLPVRRASKASDSSLIEYFGSVWSGSAIDETDATPTLESTRGSLASAPVNPLLLPESYRHARPDVGTAAVESKRLSVSSFVSAISNRAYSWSGRSSVAGSEAEGTSCVRQCTSILFTCTCIRSHADSAQ